MSVILRPEAQVYNVLAWRELTELHRALSIIQLGQVFVYLAHTELTEPHPVLSIIQLGSSQLVFNVVHRTAV